jgi:hypothetical protein
LIITARIIKRQRQAKHWAGVPPVRGRFHLSQPCEPRLIMPCRRYAGSPFTFVLIPLSSDAGPAGGDRAPDCCVRHAALREVPNCPSVIACRPPHCPVSVSLHPWIVPCRLDTARSAAVLGSHPSAVRSGTVKSGIAHYKFQFKKAGQRSDLEGIWPVQAPF